MLYVLFATLVLLASPSSAQTASEDPVAYMTDKSTEVLSYEASNLAFIAAEKCWQELGTPEGKALSKQHCVRLKRADKEYQLTHSALLRAMRITGGGGN